MNILLLIVHGLCAVFLLGALTHQTFSAVWPRRPGQTNFVARYRGVNAQGYATAVVIAFALTATLGGVIYTTYRVEVRPPLEALMDLPTIGLFELKEHFLSIAAGMLPAYWYFWKRRPDLKAARAMVTLVIAAIVWWSFVVGNIVNNVRGFF
jgi:hypothetical protein